MNASEYISTVYGVCMYTFDIGIGIGIENGEWSSSAYTQAVVGGKVREYKELVHSCCSAVCCLLYI